MDFFGNDKLTFKRVFNYLLGLWFITLGIGFSIKSNLGATPVSSIPYTLNLIWGIEIGKATIIFHAVLVLIELILLGKDFKIKPAGLCGGALRIFHNFFSWTDGIYSGSDQYPL